MMSEVSSDEPVPLCHAVSDGGDALAMECGLNYFKISEMLLRQMVRDDSGLINLER